MGKNVEAMYIDSLMARFIALNELRIGVIQFYFAIVAALLAVSFFETPSSNLLFVRFLEFGVFPLFIVGLLVFIFDMRCRARASAVGQGIRARIANAEGLKYQIIFPKKSRFDEDLLFSMIVMIINSILVIMMGVVVAKYMGSPLTAMTYWISFIFSVFMLALQLHKYRKWPQMAATMDEWPDDSFVTIISD